MNVTKWIPGMAWDAEITPATATTTCDVTIQLKDFAGNDLAEKGVVYMYVSTDPTGNITTIVDKIDITESGDGDMLELLTDSYWMAVSEDDGDIAVTIEETHDIDIYLNVVLPNGKVIHSSKIEMTS